MLKNIALKLGLVTAFLGVFMLLAPGANAQQAPVGNIDYGSDVTAEWINRITIEITVDGETYTFVDREGLDENDQFRFHAVGLTGSCESFIEGFGSELTLQDAQSGSLDFNIRATANASGCSDNDPNTGSITIANPDNSLIAFRYSGGGVIEAVDGSMIFQQVEGTDIYERRGDSNCTDILITSNGGRDVTFYELDSSGGTSGLPQEVIDHVGSGCGWSDDSDRELNAPAVGVSLPMGNFDARNDENPTLLGGGGVIGAAQPSCETGGTTGGSALGNLSGNLTSAEWWACSLLRGIDGIIGAIDGALDSLLSVTSDDYEASPGYRRAWSATKNIASIGVVLTAIFMVASTALDFGVFSAYTVRKYLPRLVISVIGLQLSWVILTFIIELVTQLGDGMEAIMFLPFEEARDLTVATLFGGTSAAQAGAVSGALFAGTSAIALAAITTMTAPGVLAIAITFVTALLGAFFFFVARKMVIILLLILSPLAIAAWVLPGNDKLWNTWRNTFFSLLFMYPALIAAIAAGKVFAWTAINGGGGGFGGALNSFGGWIIALVAYVAGYAAGPFLAKAFLGALSNIFGIVNDRSKGFIDRTRNRLKDQDKQIKDQRQQQRLRESRMRLNEGTATRRDRLRLGVLGETGRRPGDRLRPGNAATRRTAGQFHEEKERIQGFADEGELADHGLLPGTRDAQGRSSAAIKAEAARNIQVGKAEITVNNPNLEFDKAAAEVNRARGESDANEVARALRGVSVEVQQSEVDANKAVLDAANYRQDIKMAEVMADDIKQVAENTAYDNYQASVAAARAAGTVPAGSPLTGDLVIDRAQLDAGKVEVQGNLAPRALSAEFDKIQLDEAKTTATIELEAEKRRFAAAAGYAEFSDMSGVDQLRFHTDRAIQASTQLAAAQAAGDQAGILQFSAERNLSLTALAEVRGFERGGQGINTVLSSLAGTPQRQAVIDYLASAHYDIISEKAPELVGTDLHELGGSQIRDLDRSRENMWTSSFAGIMTGGSPNDIATLQRQINDLARTKDVPEAQKARVKAAAVAAGLATAQDMDDIFETAGKRYIDPTTGNITPP